MKNKYQEALDIINTSDDEKFIKDSRAYFDKYKISPVSVIQELVDEKTPMLVTDIHVDEFYCPKCHSEITHSKDDIESRPSYCENCGQRLDWSDTNE